MEWQKRWVKEGFEKHWQGTNDSFVQADIEGELGKVEPLVEQAAQAVAGISADALAEVRSLRAPPAPVRDVLEGVLRLMGIKDTSWNSMKTFLAKRGIKDEIR